MTDRIMNLFDRIFGQKLWLAKMFIIFLKIPQILVFIYLFISYLGYTSGYDGYRISAWGFIFGTVAYNIFMNRQTDKDCKPFQAKTHRFVENDIKTPAFAEQLLILFTSIEYTESLIGDLEEKFNDEIRKIGVKRAKTDTGLVYFAR